MNCKKIRNLILTDYIDKQANEREKTVIEKHFGRCPDCKKFFIAVKKMNSEMFAGIDRADPPEFVWRRIKESIKKERQKKTSLTARFLDKIKYLFYIPNPGIAFATIVALILVSGTITKFMLNKQELSMTDIREQAEFSDYSMDLPLDTAVSEEAGFGTSIEKYFL